MKTVQEHKNKKYYGSPVRVTNDEAKTLVEILGTHKYVGKSRWKRLVRDRTEPTDATIETLGDLVKRGLDRQAINELPTRVAV